MAQAQENRIEIKGTRKGLSVMLGRGDWRELLRELDERLSLADTFFRDSRVNLNTGNRNINQEQMQDLVDTLENHSVKLVSIRASSKLTVEAAKAVGVPIALPEVDRWDPGIGASARRWISEGVLMRHTLRSGQSLRHPGHVVIIGDVNPGAEVIAGGDVVVWGRLRGMVHAGAMGNEQAVICALELVPPQLRIGNHIARSPDDETRSAGQPEIASLLDGQIVAQPWNIK